MNKIRKDIILLVGILLSAFLLWMVPYLLNKNIPEVVRIIQDGHEIATYSLFENRIESISYGDENYNLLLISNGQVSVADADCPDKLCVHQHSISRNGESIICLPHKLVIQIEAKEESELDSVTY